MESRKGLDTANRIKQLEYDREKGIQEEQDQHKERMEKREN